MSTAPWPDHLLTLEEWDALPEDAHRRCELAEGVLTVVPPPAALHQLAMHQLATELNEQLPKDLVALPHVEVVVEARHPVTVRIPDIVVVSSKLVRENPPRFDPADVLLVVEIVSPGTGGRDWVTKFAEYADAGIPNYWIIELDRPNTVTAYILVDGDYEIVAQATEPVQISQPAPVTVDVRTLTIRR
jgi:Uma2 family endonuclease